MAYVAKQNIRGTSIKKGDSVDEATARRLGKDNFRADGTDYYSERNRKQKVWRKDRRRR